jgi:hypothetical protein
LSRNFSASTQDQEKATIWSSRERGDPATGRAFYKSVIAAKEEIDTETRFSMDDSSCSLLFAMLLVYRTVSYFSQSAY